MEIGEFQLLEGGSVVTDSDPRRTTRRWNSSISILSPALPLPALDQVYIREGVESYYRLEKVIESTIRSSK